MAISIIRTLIIYIVMVVSMRIMGKRQLGELEPAELAVAVLISDLAATPLQELGTPLSYGLVPAFTLLFCEVVVSAAVLKFRRVRRIVSGSPGVIIKNGEIDRAVMKKNRYTIDEMLEHLRKSGVVDISTVKFAILETDGTLSTILYDKDAPATPKQLEVGIQESEIPLIVISDGDIVWPCVTKLGFDGRWLDKRLHENGYTDASEVFLMTADSGGNIYVSPREASQ